MSVLLLTEGIVILSGIGMHGYGKGLIPMMDRELLYDMIYSLAAFDGREDILFGDCAPVAHEAFMRSLVGEAFPELWFEVPLLGDPWFDLHCLVAHADVAGTQVRYAGHDGLYDDALAWFAGCTDGVRQLAMSYDVSAGELDRPAIQLLADRRGSDVVAGFLKATGRPEATDAFRAFCTRMPSSWYACYTGVFPSRTPRNGDPFLRMECIVYDATQKAYAQDSSVLAKHLQDVGGSWVNDALVERCCELAATPFPLEFQFDVTPDGTAGATLGASVRFGSFDWVDNAKRIAMGRLMTRAQAWGLADDRWHALAQTVYAKRVTLGGEAVRLYCYPAFLKLRWRDGAPLDAKAYLIAGMERIS